MGFADSVRNTSTKMQKQVNDKAIEVASELFTVLIEKTPIADGSFGPPGTLVNNWFIGYGIGKYNRQFGSSPNPTANASRIQVSTVRSMREFLSKDGEVSLTNSTPYGYRAEYLGWPQPTWSGRVGPYAMVRNSLSQVAAKHRKVI